jgi:hypothetical protein
MMRSVAAGAREATVGDNFVGCVEAAVDGGDAERESQEMHNEDHAHSRMQARTVEFIFGNRRPQR